MDRIKAALCAIAAWAALTGVAGAAVMQCHGSASHWRDVAYSTPPMDKYKDLRNCVAWTAWQFELPEELLYSVLYVEQGPLNGRCTNNTNGTQDCGPAQINDVRLKELSRFSLTKSDIRSEPCRNVWAMGYLLRREIEKADGQIWRGVGNYHFHYSVNQRIHNDYIRRVKKAWKRLSDETAAYCSKN
ncbi:MAG: lytic transglycosylase domain-containing protein [Aeromonadales bacterium]|nr:lytic transglycosylase domain-containing protein [Aeromonadales bacterium]MDY2891663.1 lytic transglycosylase domain-containing protein [Succinivibrio sp.]